jgi:hypothetical protein
MAHMHMRDFGRYRCDTSFRWGFRARRCSAHYTATISHNFSHEASLTLDFGLIFANTGYQYDFKQRQILRIRHGA